MFYASVLGTEVEALSSTVKPVTPKEVIHILTLA